MQVWRVVFERSSQKPKRRDVRFACACVDAICVGGLAMLSGVPIVSWQILAMALLYGLGVGINIGLVGQYRTGRLRLRFVE